MHAYGGPEVLRLDEVADPIPEPHEVIVRVEAAALNHLDIDMRAGTSRLPLELPHILGCEGVGRIAALGTAVGGEWKIGDRVMILEELPCGQCRDCLRGNANRCDEGSWIGVSRPGCYAELIAIPDYGLIRLSDRLAATEWAAVQAAFGTAWHMLMTRGGMRAGETVLINAAGSGIGSAALQLAVWAGATVVATAGSEEKLSRAREMGAHHTIDYSTTDIAEGVEEITAGAGVDLVYDHVGGDVLLQSLSAVRPGGRLTTCGAHAGEVVSLDVIELFRAERTIIGSRTFTKPELEQVVKLVEQRVLSPIVDSVLPLESAAEAHRRMERRQSFGKVILVPDPSTPVASSEAEKAQTAILT
jgi:NADPH:quinone reductase-like Zn-dependent oxidoreductase